MTAALAALLAQSAAYATAQAKAARTEGHKFVFEAWPPDATERTLPGRTPPVWAATPKAARAKAAAALAKAKPGWTVGAGQHWRYDCVPPHGYDQRSWDQAGEDRVS